MAKSYCITSWLLLKFTILLVFGFVLLPSTIESAPVNPEPHVPKENEPLDPEYLELEYKKYLDEVVQVLESDEDFKRELEKMEKDKEFDSQPGQIAHYLKFASQTTRTKLDELKRVELRRLKDAHKKLLRETAAKIKAEGRRAGAADVPNQEIDHMDHKNPQTFEQEDLLKLIKKATDDLAELDKKRRSEFKTYEMEKEHEFREKVKHATPEEAEKLRAEHEAALKHHKEHPKVNQPGNKNQLEEVWEDEDRMEPDQFDPRTFFMLHDVDGDGYLSITEIEALFQKELDKVYNSSDPADDLVERQEEMNRMREHVLTNLDKDQDGMVSFEEFQDSTKTEEFNKDEDWETLDEGDVFDDKEFEVFEKTLNEKELDLLNKQKERKPANNN